MQTYLEIAEFCQLAHLEAKVVEDMLSRGALNYKTENGVVLIEATDAALAATGTALSKTDGGALAPSDRPSGLPGESFVEKTIGTILNLHEKVLDAKDETLEALKNENKFLKDALFSMQELYEEDRKTVETLTSQLKIAQDEVEFLKRKYKLMWNKAVEGFQKAENPASDSAKN